MNKCICIYLHPMHINRCNGLGIAPLSSQWFPSESNVNGALNYSMHAFANNNSNACTKYQLTDPVPCRFKCRYENSMSPLFVYTNGFLHYLSCFANRQCTQTFDIYIQ